MIGGAFAVLSTKRIDLGIHRTIQADGTVHIWKHMSTRELANTEAAASKSIESAAPLGPHILNVKQAEEPGFWHVCLENAGKLHLETVPHLFSDALRVLGTIRRMEIPSAASAIHSRGLQAELRHTLDADAVGRAFACSAGEKQLLDDAAHVLLYESAPGVRLHGEPALDEPMVPAHGDYHPRNILVQDGALRVIDWEWAGRHSVFRDIYGLVDMCYPHAQACLVESYAAVLRTRALEDAERELDLLPGALTHGYEQFVLLSRLIECRQIARDIETELRPMFGLREQANRVLRDLKIRLRRWHP